MVKFSKASKGVRCPNPTNSLILRKKQQRTNTVVYAITVVPFSHRTPTCCSSQFRKATPHSAATHTAASNPTALFWLCAASKIIKKRRSKRKIVPFREPKQSVSAFARTPALLWCFWCIQKGFRAQ